jgi:hypothetical protein
LRDDAFRAFLKPLVGSGTVTSYVAYLHRVERELGVNLDFGSLDTEKLKLELAAAGVPPKSVNNCGSALVRYNEFREASR